MELRTGASNADVEHAESVIGSRLPAVYREFLLETGGSEGPIGPASWAQFFGPEELEWHHRQYRISEHFEQFEGLALFGSDGGGTAFCFDAADDVVEADWIAAREDNRPRGTFIEFLRFLSTEVD